MREDMENRIAKLKLDDSVNEENAKDNAAELELECVSLRLFSF